MTKKKETKADHKKPEELPGMPPKPAINILAEDYVFQKGIIEAEEEKLDQIKDRIYMQMKSDGRKSFAYNHDGIIHLFEISEKVEKLVVKKSK